MKNLWFNESKTFPKKTLIFCKSQTLITSSIRRPLTSINLSLRRLFVYNPFKAFEIIFESDFNNKICLQLAMYLLSFFRFF